MPNLPFENIIVESDGSVATITLNRPKVLNALNAQLLSELSMALIELERNEDVRAIVITGSGEKAFAAGADIGELNALRNAGEGAEKARVGQAVTLQIERLRKPVIMAINGGAHLPLADALELEALEFGTLVNTEDFKEGTSAFLEKRKPDWKAR